MSACEENYGFSGLQNMLHGLYSVRSEMETADYIPIKKNCQKNVWPTVEVISI